ncbi:MAG: TauD/TfdA family dioxygenase [Sphingobium sp.]
MAIAEKNKVVVSRQAGYLGARIDGFDISDMSDADMDVAWDLLMAHSVICLSGQSCSPADYLRFGARWGEITKDGGRPVDGHPEITLLKNVGPRLTDIWHTDLSFMQRPPLATMLMAIDVPEAGGDTLFASQVAAWRGLSAPFQQFLTGLEALHVDIPRGDGKPEEQRERAVHPIVRLVDGEPALYINGMYTRSVNGLTPEESRALLDYLFTHCTQPNFTFRHRWRKGDVLIWDNRRVQHFAIFDYEGQNREMHRMVVRDTGRPGTGA